MKENTQKKPGSVVPVGQSNVGKSTLMNHLVGQKIAITPDEPWTTRNKIQTVYMNGRGQIIPLNTPEIHKAKNKLGEYMADVAEHTLKSVDMVLWLMRLTTFIDAGEHRIAGQLNKTRTSVVLVINKIDTMKQQNEILIFMAVYKDVYRFAKIVSLSALKDKNTDLLTELIFKYLPYGPQFCDEDTVADQPMCQIAPELIREGTLRLLNDEIPHGIAVTVEKMKEHPNGIVGIDASTMCERDSHRGIITGKDGGMLRRIGTEAREGIGRMMDMQVNLQLQVKVRKE